MASEEAQERGARRRQRLGRRTPFKKGPPPPVTGPGKSRNIGLWKKDTQGILDEKPPSRKEIETARGGLSRTTVPSLGGAPPTAMPRHRGQPSEAYGGRTRAALAADQELVASRFRDRAAATKAVRGGIKIGPFLSRPNMQSAVLRDEGYPESHTVGADRSRSESKVPHTTAQERMDQAEQYPRDVFREITEHESWRNLMEESPAHTAGTRESFDALLSPRGGRAVKRAMRGEPQPIAMSLGGAPSQMLQLSGPLTHWPGTTVPVDPEWDPRVSRRNPENRFIMSTSAPAPTRSLIRKMDEMFRTESGEDDPFVGLEASKRIRK